MNNDKKRRKKLTLIILIQILIATIFVIGIDEKNIKLNQLFSSYFADIAIPFAFYFLICINEDQYDFLKPWYLKVFIILFITFTSEILQYFGIYAFARIFDPIDLVMYIFGASLAAIIDRNIFSKIFDFWD